MPTNIATHTPRTAAPWSTSFATCGKTCGMTFCLVFGITVLCGCNDLSAALPAGTSNPSVYNSPAGALMKRNAADSVFEKAVLGYVKTAGLLTDELENPLTGEPSFDGTVRVSLDERILPQEADNQDYNNLQQLRGTTNEAIGAFTKYDPTGSPALRGEMYAVQGYAEIMLAELFCSGVPLTTLDFENNFTYRSGSTQQQVYQDAIVKLDSAQALSSDSVRILNLARVGLGRAYLNLGDYTHAAAAVASVPDGFRYQVNVQWTTQSDVANRGGFADIMVSDNEGINGLSFLSSGDPRARATASVILPLQNIQLYFPEKYAVALQNPYYSPITVADGVEARLIQAEAALQAGNASWLTILNALRTTSTTCTVLTTPCSAPAGTGGVDGLPLLVDPGSSTGDTARVNLLFTERAYWLYMTGHRQGDLRRLVRQYHRSQNTVYPTGPYLAPGLELYGSDVTVAVPATEDLNPYFHGCLDRNA